MTLPYDYARCPGGTLPECKACRRTEPGSPVWQSFFTAPPHDESECLHHIGYKNTTHPPADS